MEANYARKGLGVEGFGLRSKRPRRLGTYKGQTRGQLRS